MDGTDPSENEFSHQLPLERGGAWPSGSTGRGKKERKRSDFPSELAKEQIKKGQTVTARKVTHLHNKWESKRVLTQWNQPQANPPSSPSLTSFSPVYQIKRVENHPVFNETVNCELSCNPDKGCESSSQLVLISFLLNSKRQEQK